MVKKKKPDSDSDSDSDSDTSIVFESDDAITEPCWSDQSSNSSESSEDESIFGPSDLDSDEDDTPTLIINIKEIKHVKFNETVTTHIVEIEDRKGYWTEDRCRFQQRCMLVQEAISFIFSEIHRSRLRIIVNMSNNIVALRVGFCETYVNISSRHPTTPMRVCEPSEPSEPSEPTIPRILALPAPSWWQSYISPTIK